MLGIQEKKTEESLLFWQYHTFYFTQWVKNNWPYVQKKMSILSSDYSCLLIIAFLLVHNLHCVTPIPYRLHTCILGGICLCHISLCLLYVGEGGGGPTKILVGTTLFPFLFGKNTFELCEHSVPRRGILSVLHHLHHIIKTKAKRPWSLTMNWMHVMFEWWCHLESARPSILKL